MKRNLINKNKKRYSYIFSTGYFLRDMIYDYELKKEFMIDKNMSKYNRELDYERCSVLCADNELLSVPVVLYAKNRRSRINNYIDCYYCITLDEYNIKFSTNKSIEDFPEM